VFNLNDMQIFRVLSLLNTDWLTVVYSLIQ